VAIAGRGTSVDGAGESDAWANVIRAELLRRDAAGDWPELAITIENGKLDLRSIDFTIELPAIDRGTRLASG
jgi:hypothetical protein